MPGLTGAGYTPMPGPTGAGYAPMPGPTGAGFAPMPGPTGVGFAPMPGPTGAGFVPMPGPTGHPAGPPTPSIGSSDGLVPRVSSVSSTSYTDPAAPPPAHVPSPCEGIEQTTNL